MSGGEDIRRNLQNKILYIDRIGIEIKEQNMVIYYEILVRKNRKDSHRRSGV